MGRGGAHELTHYAVTCPVLSSVVAIVTMVSGNRRVMTTLNRLARQPAALPQPCPSTRIRRHTQLLRTVHDITQRDNQ